MELIKVPDPVPSMVMLSVTVGLNFVLQHTPLAEIIDPPVDVMIPPLTIEVELTKFNGVVDNSGIEMEFSFLQLFVRINSNPKIINGQD
jgi:hypothetical protein